MLKTVNFLCLFMLIATMVFGDAPIEIISGGTAYASMDAYREARMTQFMGKRETVQQPSPIKAYKKVTVPAPPQALITAETAQTLRRMGVEDGLQRVHVDFKQNWDNPAAGFVVSSGELEERLEALADGRKEPLLFISDANKLRVMSLDKDKAQPEIVP